MALKASTSQNSAHTALDFVFYQKFNDYESSKQVGLATASDPALFKQDTADGDRVIYDQYSGVGMTGQRTNEEAELASYSPRVTNNVSLNVLDFNQSVDVPRNFMLDEKHGIVRKNTQEMARAARIAQDNYNLDRYSLGFTTVVTNDSVAWFSNSHTTIDGTTVDNLETGVLTAANLETLIVSLQRQKDQAGKLGYHHAKTLLVPSSLLKEACEIVDSELLSGTGNNNINYLSRKFPGLTVKYSSFLDDNSTTAYFLLGGDHSATRFVREGVHTNYISWENSKNWVGTYQIGFREVTNPISYEGSAASNGSV